ncbi:MAG: DUF1579 domain-containing protein [Alphaproteobacteria bacterium]|nr:DUF1579 domain-containing protein [Alphaproteobacteria bacterium]
MRSYILSSFALLTCLTPAALAQTQPGPEHQWLADNFSGGFTWYAADPETGEPVSGRGNCTMEFGGFYLRCVHLSPDGVPMGVGISGFNQAAGHYEWTFYGGGGSSIAFGEGRSERSLENPVSIVEGLTYLPDGSQSAFRSETRKDPNGGWTYVYFLGQGEAAMPVYRARFVYDLEVSEDDPR